jgi:hypothetical protein
MAASDLQVFYSVVEVKVSKDLIWYSTTSSHELIFSMKYLLNAHLNLNTPQSHFSLPQTNSQLKKWYTWTYCNKLWNQRVAREWGFQTVFLIPVLLGYLHCRQSILWDFFLSHLSWFWLIMDSFQVLAHQWSQSQLTLHALNALWTFLTGF